MAVLFELGSGLILMDEKRSFFNQRLLAFFAHGFTMVLMVKKRGQKPVALKGDNSEPISETIENRDGERGRFGYARVSTVDQNLDLQIDALKAERCGMIFIERSSTRHADRRLWGQFLNHRRAGQTVVVWRFDRLARSVAELIDITQYLASCEVDLVSVTEKIDTSSPMGRMTFHVLAAVAQFERDLIRERTLAGLESARARGRIGGRPKALTRAQIALAVKLREKGSSNRQTAKSFGVSHSTVGDALRQYDDDMRQAEAGADGWAIDSHGLPFRYD